MLRRLVPIALMTLVAACGGISPTPSSTSSASPSAASAPASATLAPPTAVVPSPPVTQSPAATLTKLAIDATGLGPCDQPWWTTCEYGIRLEGADGYDHRGTFSWDEGPRKGMAHGTAGPVHSTGVGGDLPTALGPGSWTLSFRLFYGSDAISYNPVPGGTPRLSWEDPFTAACSTDVDAAGVVSVAIHVAFTGSACKVVTKIVRG